MTNADIEAAIARELQETTGALPVDAVDVAALADRPGRIALLAELDDLRLLFEELRGHVIDGGGAARATSRWTVLHLAAHLASWQMETRRELERILAGGAFGYDIHFHPEGGPSEWNQREVDARATLSAAAIFAEIDAETARIAELVESAPAAALASTVELPRTSGEPPQRWRMPLGAMVAASCWHARLHLRRLRPLVAKRELWP
jgi:hypothetical protein